LYNTTVATDGNISHDAMTNTHRQYMLPCSIRKSLRQASNWAAKSVD